MLRLFRINFVLPAHLSFRVYQVVYYIDVLEQKVFKRLFVRHSRNILDHVQQITKSLQGEYYL